MSDDASADDGEAELVERLRAGDESAFAHLLDTYYGSMLRVARQYVSTKEAAEDVVQETFLGVIQGIDRFERRSSVRTWMFRILVNRATTRGERDDRSRPFSSLTALELAADEPAVAPDRFLTDGRWSGFWSAPPPAVELPEAAALAGEIREHVQRAIETLPPGQRTVIELRDVQGFTSAEVCDVLGISEVNQRVLLHRARSATRAQLEEYLRERVTSSE